MNPKYKKPRRRLGRRPAVKRKPTRPRGNGGFLISRRSPPIYVTNSSLAGVPDNTNPIILTLGTPELLPITIGTDNYQLPFAMSFNLKQLAQYTDIVNICDRYKIVSAMVKISYNANSTTGTGAGAINASPQFMPIVNYIVDKDDDGVQTSNQLLARTGLKSKVFRNGNDFVKIKCAPVPAPIVYDGVASAYSVPATAQWINSGYPDVPHYGVKGYIQNFCLLSATQVVSALTFDVTLVVHAKDLQ